MLAALSGAACSVLQPSTELTEGVSGSLLPMRREPSPPAKKPEEPSDEAVANATAAQIEFGEGTTAWGAHQTESSLSRPPPQAAPTRLSRRSLVPC